MRLRNQRLSIAKMEGSKIGRMVVLTIRVPEELLEELNRKVGRGKRSAFIKEAIIEKLRQEDTEETAELKSEIEQLRMRILHLEKAIKTGKGVEGPEEKPSPLLRVCFDETDRLIVKRLLESGGATTKELEDVTGLKRRQILTRLKRIAGRAEEKFGRRVIQFKRSKIRGKKQAWWIEASQLADQNT
ncbi:MAG: ribbon-helix-helix domain-containing protein [Candidatus Freyarchaeota archaeon]